MSPFKSKDEFDYAEAADCETLYTELSFRPPSQRKRMISIGVLENDAIGKEGTISFQIITFYPDRVCDVSTANLTEEEIDMVMDGLKKAKERMMEYKMKYDEDDEPEDTYGDDDSQTDEDVHSDDWGDTESEEEQGFDDDERD